MKKFYEFMAIGLPGAALGAFFSDKTNELILLSALAIYFKLLAMGESK